MTGIRLLSPRVDISGQQTGSIKIMSFSRYIEDDKGRRKAYYNCLCDCGKIIEVNPASSKSCGCTRSAKIGKQMAIRNRNLGKGILSPEFKTILSNYKMRAKKKNYAFDLTDKQFYTITKSNCIYCGSEPFNFVKMRKSKYIEREKYFYMGIDRVDSKIGYTTTNCIPCCEICNKAKRDLSAEEFWNWIVKLSSFVHINYLKSTGLL